MSILREINECISIFITFNKNLQLKNKSFLLNKVTFSFLVNYYVVLNHFINILVIF